MLLFVLMQLKTSRCRKAATGRTSRVLFKQQLPFLFLFFNVLDLNNTINGLSATAYHLLLQMSH